MTVKDNDNSNAKGKDMTTREVKPDGTKVYNVTEFWGAYWIAVTGPVAVLTVQGRERCGGKVIERRAAAQIIRNGRKCK